jgi:hypothetical protein
MGRTGLRKDSTEKEQAKDRGQGQAKGSPGTGQEQGKGSLWTGQGQVKGHEKNKDRPSSMTRIAIRPEYRVHR